MESTLFEIDLGANRTLPTPLWSCRSQSEGTRSRATAHTALDIFSRIGRKKRHAHLDEMAARLADLRIIVGEVNTLVATCQTLREDLAACAQTQLSLVTSFSNLHHLCPASSDSFSNSILIIKSTTASVADLVCGLEIFISRISTLAEKSQKGIATLDALYSKYASLYKDVLRAVRKEAKRESAPTPSKDLGLMLDAFRGEIDTLVRQQVCCLCPYPLFIPISCISHA